MNAVQIGAPLWSDELDARAGERAARLSDRLVIGQAVPIMDSPHVSVQEMDTVGYNSLPPSSGPHFGFAITTGIYREPLCEGLTVYAMEHGHVVIQYAGDTPPETVERLERVAKRYARDVILAPYPKLAHGIALTALGAH